MFGYDVLSCRRCGQPMHLIALIEQADAIRRILVHLGLPTDVPEAAPARAPPRLYDSGDDVASGLDVDAGRTCEPAIDDPC